MEVNISQVNVKKFREIVCPSKKEIKEKQFYTITHFSQLMKNADYIQKIENLSSCVY